MRCRVVVLPELFRVHDDALAARQNSKRFHRKPIHRDGAEIFPETIVGNPGCPIPQTPSYPELPTQLPIPYPGFSLQVSLETRSIPFGLASSTSLLRG